MIDKEVVINALFSRIKVGQLTIEQIPEAFRAEVQALIDADNENEESEGT